MFHSDLGVAVDQEIKSLVTSINSQFNDLRKIPYRLQSVFIHRGFVQSGHYWIYIRDFQTNIWRKYNDEYVEEVKNTKEIFEQELTDRPATSYFVVYVNDGLKEQLVNPVCRDTFDEPQEPEPYDTYTNDQPLESEDDPMEDAVNGNTTDQGGSNDPNGVSPSNFDEWMQGSPDQGFQSGSDKKIRRAITENAAHKTSWDRYASSRGDSW